MGKTKSVLLAAVAMAAFAMPANATLVVDLTGASFANISTAPGGNDFESNLAALVPSLTQYATGYQSVSVAGAPLKISVYRAGSESGLENWVEVNGYQFNENADSWDVGDFLISFTQAADGALGGNINFFNDDGDSSPLVSGQVAVFLPGQVGSSYSNNDLFFGFNDSGSPDGDFDDYIIRVSAGPVPEPATWALLIAGFALVGVSMRRRRTTISFA